MKSYNYTNRLEAFLEKNLAKLVHNVHVPEAVSHTPRNQKLPTILNPSCPFGVMIIIVVEEVITRVTSNDEKRRRSESSLIRSGLCFLDTLPEVVVFDNGREMGCEI